MTCTDGRKSWKFRRPSGRQSLSAIKRALTGFDKVVVKELVSPDGNALKILTDHRCLFRSVEEDIQFV